MVQTSHRHQAQQCRSSRRRDLTSSGMAHTHTSSQTQRRSSLSKNASVSRCKHRVSWTPLRTKDCKQLKQN